MRLTSLAPRLRMQSLAILLGLALLAPVATAQPSSADAQAIYDRAIASVAVVHVTANGNTGIGTAFVIDSGGLLATAAHVARQAEHISVEFAEGDPVEARVVGYDARRDLALLRIIPRAPLPALEVADSSSVRQGDSVVVLGTPRGRPRVMTTGVVRGTGLTLPGQAPDIFILFDAVVQPGNSGGPLLNDRGQVIGIVVASTTQPGASGGLAVSSAALKASLPALLEGARLERAWMGIAGVTIGPDVLRQRRLGASRGVLIVEVVPGGPGERAGLRGENTEGPPGDIIVSANGEAIEDWEDLLSVLGARQPGDRLRLGIVRGPNFFEVQLTLDARP